MGKLVEQVEHADSWELSQIREFVHDGPAIVVGTRSPTMHPHLCRGWAPTLSRDGRRLRMYVSTVQAELCLDDLRSCREVAMVCSRVRDYRTLQIKGVCVGFEGSEKTQDDLAKYWQRMVDGMCRVGLTPEQVNSFWASGLTELTIDVRDYFEQTPGPNAGTRIKLGPHAD